VFDQILQMDDISQKTLIDSLNLHLNNDQVFQAGEGAGSSGSFFFFSYDQKFLIKTLKEQEIKTLGKTIMPYLQHLINNPDSLLARIYGLFAIKTQYFDNLFVMVMQNTYLSTPNIDCSLKFDMKGSRISRRTKKMLSTKRMEQV